jgi:hypothetical protein
LVSDCRDLITCQYTVTAPQSGLPCLAARAERVLKVSKDDDSFGLAWDMEEVSAASLAANLLASNNNSHLAVVATGASYTGAARASGLVELGSTHRLSNIFHKVGLQVY